MPNDTKNDMPETIKTNTWARLSTNFSSTVQCQKNLGCPLVVWTNKNDAMLFLIYFLWQQEYRVRQMNLSRTLLKGNENAKKEGRKRKQHSLRHTCQTCVSASILSRCPIVSQIIGDIGCIDSLKLLRCASPGLSIFKAWLFLIEQSDMCSILNSDGGIHTLAFPIGRGSKEDEPVRFLDSDIRNKELYKA